MIKRKTNDLESRDFCASNEFPHPPMLELKFEIASTWGDAS